MPGHIYNVWHKSCHAIHVCYNSAILFPTIIRNLVLNQNLMQNGCGYVNISVRWLHIVRFHVKRIAMVTISHQYSLQEHVFLLLANYC